MSSFFKDKLENAFLTIPAKKNFLLSLIILGRYNVKNLILPDCYKEERFNLIKKRLQHVAIELTSESLVSYLRKAPNNYFDSYSLSDVVSYISPEEVSQLITELIRTSADSAVIVLRQLLTRYNFDVILAPYSNQIIRKNELEVLCQAEDSTFIWDFFIFQVKTEVTK